MSLASRVLMVWAWVAATAVVFCLYMIARFFQQKSGERSYYQLFLIPVVLYLFASFRYLLPDTDFAVDEAANALLFIAGTGTLGLGSYLFNLMTGGRR
ncbi:MAG: hypothetical protein H5T59_02915 [Anaerolineae bacterium]|nr:hypothetical protein [Anaerolineae bacterium]